MGGGRGVGGWGGCVGGRGCSWTRAGLLSGGAFILLAAVMRRSRPSAELRRLLIFSIAILAGLLVAQWVMGSIVPYRSMVVETIDERDTQIDDLSKSEAVGKKSKRIRESRVECKEHVLKKKKQYKNKY